METIDWDYKIDLYQDHLRNGGAENIWFPELLGDLLKVKKIYGSNKVDEKTLTPIVKATIEGYFLSQSEEPYITKDALSEYYTLHQKSFYFTQEKVETEKEFDEIYEEYSKKKDILFRGLNEAKYRLYSSLQRSWITEKLDKNHDYLQFLKSLINNVRKEQGGIFIKYLECTGFDSENELGALSFLQHHSCPTPLLDWTYSFAHALFFAIGNPSPPKSKRQIDNYFCVYMLDEDKLNPNGLKEFIEITFEENRKQLKTEVIERYRVRGFCNDCIKLMDDLYTDDHIKPLFMNTHGKKALRSVTTLDSLFEQTFSYFSDFKKDFNMHLFLNNNLNIINQQGAFTWNSHPTHPLEEVVNNEFKASNIGGNFSFSKCVNINKNLSGYINAKLKANGITKDFIYPNSNKIAKAAFNKTKKKKQNKNQEHS